MDYLNHYINGMVAGCIGTIVSHPFFTIKTKLQNNENPFEVMKKQSNRNNFKFLYSGFLRMCIGLSIEKMLVFGTYHTTLIHLNLDKNNYFHSMFAGFVSGIAGAYSSTISEQLVIDKQYGIKNYTLTHLYKGLVPTIGRESIGFAVYFSTYDFLSKKWNQNKNLMHTIWIGTVSISTALIFFYPLDKIKTNIQTGVKIDSATIKTAYKGAHYGLLRAIPFHVTCFVVFEEMKKLRI